MSESQRSVGDHYDTLGVLRDASTDEIKKAFRKLARECHPDVAGDAPEAHARFTQVREAYETLVDPVRRATYDRRGYATFFSGPGRKGGKWRPPGGFDFEQVGDPKPGGRSGSTIRRGRRNPANDIGLEDIFGDFGGGDVGQHAGPKASPANRGTWGRPVGGGGASPGASSGHDIQMKVDVPASIADNGGTVTLNYPRLRRGDDGSSLHRYDEIHDLRVPPGVSRGDSLRVPGMGDAGPGGGPYGDLVCDVTVVPDGMVDEEPQQRPSSRARSQSRSQARARPGARPAASNPASVGSGTTDAPQIVDISVVEALLGGRVKIDTPAGAVHVTVPPCTASGSRLRLRGRGAAGADHFVELRIVTPNTLDAESRSLIQRFAELNPIGPRGE